MRKAGTFMQKTKVGFTHSMLSKILALFTIGIFITSGILIAVSFVQSQNSTKELLQNYMLSEATSNGTILDNAMESNGKELLNDATKLNNLLSDVKVTGMDTSYAYLVSSEGTMLYHPTADKIGSPVENVVVTQLVSDLSKGIIAEPECVDYDFKGTIKYASYYINDGGDYILVITADEDDAFSSISSMKNTMIFCMAIVLVVLLTLGFFFIRKIVKPIHILTNILQRVEQRQASKNAHRQLLFYDS